jgi:hypothetical protein
MAWRQSKEPVKTLNQMIAENPYPEEKIGKRIQNRIKKNIALINEKEKENQKKYISNILKSIERQNKQNERTPWQRKYCKGMKRARVHSNVRLFPKETVGNKIFA